MKNSFKEKSVRNNIYDLPYIALTVKKEFEKETVVRYKFQVYIYLDAK